MYWWASELPTRTGYVDDSPMVRAGSSPILAWFRKINTEGWQLAVIEVPDLPDNAKFELFLTHLQGVTKGGGADRNEDKKQRTKIKQMREVRDVIKERIEDEEYRKRPKILMGDFNIHSRERGPQFDDRYPRPGTYFGLFLSEMKSIGMQEAWLTHGSPALSYESKNCNPESNGYTCDPFEPPEGMLVEEYYRQDRIDYVFIEEPREEHEIRLDLSQMKMASFDQGGFSDHNGITFELLTSSAG